MPRHLLLEGNRKRLVGISGQGHARRHRVPAEAGNEAGIAGRHRVQDIPDMNAWDGAGGALDLSGVAVGKGNGRPIIFLFYTRSQYSDYTLMPLCLINTNLP